MRYTINIAARLALVTEEAKTQAWGGNNEGHFVVAKIDGPVMTVIPFGKLNERGELRPIDINFINAGVRVPFQVDLSLTAARGV